jgi:AcrR family transcriptional regulator
MNLETKAARTRSPRGEGDLLKETMLDATADLLAESGDVDGISVRAITARVGVSPTALYLHFETKEALIEEVRRRCFRLLEQELRRTGEPGDDPRLRLRAMGATYLRFAAEHPGHYAVLFKSSITRCEESAVDPQRPGMEVFDRLVEAVERCGIEPEDAFERSVLLWMGLHGRVSVAVGMPRFPFPPDERYVETLVERVVGSDLSGAAG